MSDTSVTIAGNATRDPEIRYTAAGVPVASFGVAVGTRKKEGDGWVDGPTHFFDVTCWRQLAENVAESVEKGTRVVVTGRLEYQSWETDDGQKRSKVQIVADEVGPSLRWATCEVTRTERSDRAVAAKNTAPVDDSEIPF